MPSSLFEASLLIKWKGKKSSNFDKNVAIDSVCNLLYVPNVIFFFGNFHTGKMKSNQNLCMYH